MYFQEARSSRDTSHLLTAAEFGNRSESTGIAFQDSTNNFFKPLRSIVLATIQIILNTALVLESILFFNYSPLCKNDDKTGNTSNLTLFFKQGKVGCATIVLYTIILAWIFTWILKIIFETLHRRHRHGGYLQLYSQIHWISVIPFNVMNLGNTVILIGLTLKLENLLPHSTKFPQNPFQFLIQVIVFLEFSVVLISSIIYIVKVARFNRSRPEPDVIHDDILPNVPVLINSAVQLAPGLGRQSNEIGQLQSVCERQADLIECLRHRCDVLAGRLYQLNNVQT